MNDLSLKNAQVRNGVSLNAYHSVWQMRSDGWNTLNDAMSRLAVEAPKGVDTTALRQRIVEALARLEPIESFWAFPGRAAFRRLQTLFQAGEIEAAQALIARITRALTNHSYRRHQISLMVDEGLGQIESEDAYSEEETDPTVQLAKPYFEMLVVDHLSEREEEALKTGLKRMRRAEDKFVYEIVVVQSFEDALIAVMINFNLQACVIRHGFPIQSKYELDMLHRLLGEDSDERLEKLTESERGPLLGSKIAELRPELDLYLVTDISVEEVAGKLGSSFNRVFYQEEDYTELNLSILRGVEARYRTPFFTALREYSKQPTGVFHALPISRGKSIVRSNWIQDMLEFYGMNVFLAETSATSGGLDSLLDPIGPIKLAQEYAARAFGAQRTFFATNGTSTCNKIVVQALVAPGDIVLVDRNCHKSHHYGMVLAGARVAYLDSYPLDAFSMYGAVPLRDIKKTLLDFRRAGQLDKVKMLTLTNCTFDGLIYDVERVMEECLAIKPDLVFLWDEAWFAFARFHPAYRHRTGMHAAQVLKDRYRDPAYRKRYDDFRARMDAAGDDDAAWLDNRLLADPDKARVRVYATQSTHKTLTALRQGSMIHVHDQDFRAKVEDAFHEAYMTHTSTSPNYQILASLDLGRRQVELEGYELVQKQIDQAMVLRERIKTHPLLSKHFKFLSMHDIIPPQYRPSGLEHYFNPERGYARMDEAWRQDEFALDPTRLNLYIGHTGIDGDTFKHEYLMDKYGIQINKTSRNTVLFMTNIGTTRSSIAYLIEILVKIAQELDAKGEDRSPVEQKIHAQRVRSLTEDLPPLPDFSHFHPAFRGGGTDHTREGELRGAFFMAYDELQCDYVTLPDLKLRILNGGEVVSAMFVIPYPPGFPILVPGQVISQPILEFIEALDTREIHGYRPVVGYKVFTDEDIKNTTRTAKQATPNASRHRAT
jgi:arginine decarboxylase